MATDLIAGIREELNRIKGLRKKSFKKVDLETLKSYPGFEEMSIENRQQFLDTIRELCQLALKSIDNGNKCEGE